MLTIFSAAFLRDLDGMERKVQTTLNGIENTKSKFGCIKSLLQRSVKEKLSKDRAEFQNSRPLVCTVSVVAVIV